MTSVTAYQLPDYRIGLRLARGINETWYAYDDPSDAVAAFFEATQHPIRWSEWAKPDLDLQLDAVGWSIDPDDGPTWLADWDPDWDPDDGIEVNQDYLSDLFSGPRNTAARDFCRMLTIYQKETENA